MSTAIFELAGWRTEFHALGQGTPVVYLHGFDVPAEDAAFLGRLREDHTVYVPKLPGFGGATDDKDSIRNIQDLALHIREFIESTGEQSVDLIGHSLGGMIAAEVAAISPGLVRRLVLVDSYGLWDDNDPLPDPFMKSGPAFRTAMGDPDADAARDPMAEAIWRATDLGASTRYLWPIPERGLARRLKFVKVPTLVVHGEKDQLIPVSYAQRLAEQLPDGRLQVINGAGHAPMLDRTEEFAAALRPFLS